MTAPFIGTWTFRLDGEDRELTAVVVSVAVLGEGRVAWAYISEMGNIFASDESDFHLRFDRIAEPDDMENPWSLFAEKVLEPA